MTEIRRFHHRSMATFFEVAIPFRGEAGAVCLAETLFAEIDRVERLLSKFDPTSEISRINRYAAIDPVRVDAELFTLLVLCQEFWRQTDGAFDPVGCCFGSPVHFGSVELDPGERTVRFHHPEVRLDLGAVGKGYALERCRQILADLSIDNLFLHGGTSSVLALGCGPEGEGWRVGIRPPGSPEKRRPLRTLLLSDRALSSSAVLSESAPTSDLFDPRAQVPLAGESGCTVIAGCAAVAEILSTAFLVMGRTATREFLNVYPEVAETVLWMEGGEAEVEPLEREEVRA